MTVILGIDPGSRKTGFGLISVDRNKPHYVSSGTIHLPSKEPLSVRLKVLFE
ncbi:MAG: crossover junction endodeoxyribonuclease RuvC, partial [Halieaceae bacterium]|nr:crossover junction endodeoxyribonuclease RuvC [Halieaceae bacterium]